MVGIFSSVDGLNQDRRSHPPANLHCRLHPEPRVGIAASIASATGYVNDVARQHH
jgi:hypothetical protein